MPGYADTSTYENFSFNIDPYCHRDGVADGLVFGAG